MTTDTYQDMPRSKAETIYAELGFEKIAQFPENGLTSVFGLSNATGYEIVHYARRDGVLLSAHYDANRGLFKGEHQLKDQELVCHWKSYEPTSHEIIPPGFSSHNICGFNSHHTTPLLYNEISGLKTALAALENKGTFVSLREKDFPVKVFGTHQVDFDHTSRVYDVDFIRDRRKDDHPQWVKDMII